MTTSPAVDPTRTTGSQAGAASPAAAALTGAPAPGGRAKPVRPVWSATVVRRETLSDTMVRVVLTSPQFADFPELPCTDHYVKLIFPAPGSGLVWPFDPDEVRATRPAEEWPVTRTYTVRWFDRTRNELALDFVVHGSAGLAGPWAAAAEPGDRIGFRGPGGAFVPEPASGQLLIGDEAALPAIAATLDRLPATTPVLVLAEVGGEGERIALPRTGPEVEVHWIHRDGAAYGERLLAVVDDLASPDRVARLGAQPQAFVHGNAEMIRVLRRHLFGTLGLPRGRVSVSGYWRPGHTEDRWQATKRDFNAAMEADVITATEAPGAA